MDALDPTADPQQQQGPPPGAVATPIAAATAGPPPGAVATPIAQAATTAPTQPAAPAPPQSVMGRIGGMLGDVYDAYNETQKGFAKGAMNTVAGAEELLNKYGKAAAQAAIPGEPVDLDDPGLHSAALKQASDWLRDHAQEHGVWQQLGSMGESVAELLIPGLGEETGAADAAKAAATFGDKAAQTAKLAKFLEQNPRIAQLAAVGARTVKAAAAGALQAGGQTFVKTGGDLPASAEAAAGGGVVGGALEGVVGGVQAARAAYAAKAGAAADTSASYNEALAKYHQAVADRASGAEDAKNYRQGKVDAQQADWQKAVQEQDRAHAAAMEAHRAALTTRGQQMEQARAQWKAAIDAQDKAHQAAMEAYTQQVGERTAAQEAQRTAWKAELDRQAQQHAADIAEYNRQLGEHTRNVKQMQTEAANALTAQRQIEAQQGVVNIAKNATEDTLTRFNKVMSDAGLPTVNATEIAGGVRTFGDMADALGQAGKAAYDSIDSATGGKFTELKNARIKAYNSGDQAAYAKATDAIDQLMATKPQGVTPEVYGAGKTMWNAERDVDRIHNAVESGFNLSETRAANSGVPRTMNGGTIQANISRLARGSNPISEARIAELLGPEGLAGIDRAAHMTSTPALRKATRDLAEEVAAQLQAQAPVKPSAPVAPEKPAPLPAVEKPEKPVAPAKPDFGPKPVAPVRPEPIPKPDMVPRPPPQGPVPVKPTAPPKPSNMELALKVGRHLSATAVGTGVLEHAGIPYYAAAPLSFAGVEGTRYVMRQIITNPAIGKMAEYAVDYGATPKNAAKVIAAMIQRQETEASLAQRQGEGQDKEK